MANNRSAKIPAAEAAIIKQLRFSLYEDKGSQYIISASLVKSSSMDQVLYDAKRQGPARRAFLAQILN